MAFNPESTSSVHRGLVSSGMHEFRVDSFSLIKGKGIGRYVNSDRFTVGGYEFQVLLYPDGYSQETSDYVSISVQLLSRPPSAITAWLEFYLIDRYGDRWRVSDNASPLQHLTTDEFYRLGPSPMSTDIHTWGYADFYLRALLESSDLLRNDRLTIQCTVTIAKTATSACDITPTSDLKESLKRLFEEGPGMDVSFGVADEVIQAHKCVLSNRSDFFRALIANQVDNNAIIQIEEIKAPIFRAMLRYLYSDDVPDFDTRTTLDLFEAADKYCISTLRSICLSQLCENLSIEQVGLCLGVADRLNCELLKTRCFWFISMPENNQAVMRTTAMKNLADQRSNLMCELVEYVAGRTPSSG